MNVSHAHKLQLIKQWMEQWKKQQCIHREHSIQWKNQDKWLVHCCGDLQRELVLAITTLIWISK